MKAQLLLLKAQEPKAVVLHQVASHPEAQTTVETKRAQTLEEAIQDTHLVVIHQVDTHQVDMEEAHKSLHNKCWNSHKQISNLNTCHQTNVKPRQSAKAKNLPTKNF